MFQFIGNIIRNKYILSGGGILVVIGCFILLFITSSLVFKSVGLVYDINGVVSCDNFRYAGIVKVDLPPSATILRERCSESFNPSYDVVFTMQADELTTFQQYISEIEVWQPNSSNSWYSELVWQEAEKDLRNQGASLETALYGWYGNGIVDVHVVIDTSNTLYFVYYYASYVD